jgi:hypothetical protein
MKCDCVHKPVCPYPGQIREAVGNIIVMRFGGIDPAWHELGKFIRENCQHRIPTKEPEKVEEQ